MRSSGSIEKPVWRTHSKEPAEELLCGPPSLRASLSRKCAPGFYEPNEHRRLPKRMSGSPNATRKPHTRKRAQVDFAASRRAASPAAFPYSCSKQACFYPMTASTHATNSLYERDPSATAMIVRYKSSPRGLNRTSLPRRNMPRQAAPVRLLPSTKGWLFTIPNA